MLAFFPECNEDELLYSVLARYHQMSGNVSLKGTLLDLFGTDTICSVTDLQSHLADLCNRLPGNIQPDYLIQRHTLLPFYAPFFPTERVLAIRQCMLGHKGGAIHMLAGIMASGVPVPSHLRYCGSCVISDEENFGQPYWRRIHQVPGVLVCPTHHVLLKNTTIPYTLRKNRQGFDVLSHQVAEIHQNKPCELEMQRQTLFVAKQAQWLLTHTVKPQELDELRTFYLARLQSLGYITQGGSIRFRDLVPDFLLHHGVEFLQKQHSCVDVNDEDTWIHKLLRKPRTSCHPLRHILFLDFLHESVCTLFDKSLPDDSTSPFGEGPWPCLNKAARHYKENVVTECIVKLNQTTKQPVGTFNCDCGFIYTRNGPDLEENDRYTGRTKSFGEAWLSELQELSKQGLSLREIGRRLGADTNSVKKHLLILKKPSTQPQDTNEFLMKSELYREQWLSHLNQNKFSSRTELRKSNPAVYSWLYRHDREWLMNSLPPTRQTFEKPTRIDWPVRDEQLRELILQAVNDLLTFRQPPVRITVSRIGQHIRQLALLEKHLNKLPLTKELLEQVTETVEQFRMRRVSIISDNLRKEGSDLKHWKIVRKAGLRPDYGPIVEYHILQEMSLESVEITLL